MMKAKKMENSHLPSVKVEPTQNKPAIAYDRTGSGPPMVFVHGLAYDRRRIWKPAIERLSDAYTCINLDLPGHGESLEAETYDLEALSAISTSWLSGSTL
jgi:pimeloyl-ACP methyl ester carboxylesterase